MESKIFSILRWQKDRTQYDLLIDTENINSLDEFNHNFLQIAISRNKTDICLDLIQRNIDIDHVDYEGATALQYAADYNNYVVAEMLIKKGCTVNIKDKHGNNALWAAVYGSKGKKFDVAKLIFENGGNPHSVNIYGKTPLDFAIKANYTTLIELFSKNKD